MKSSSGRIESFCIFSLRAFCCFLRWCECWCLFFCFNFMFAYCLEYKLILYLWTHTYRLMNSIFKTFHKNLLFNDISTWGLHKELIVWVTHEGTSHWSWASLVGIQHQSLSILLKTRNSGGSKNPCPNHKQPQDGTQNSLVLQRPLRCRNAGLLASAASDLRPKALQSLI